MMPKHFIVDKCLDVFLFFLVQDSGFLDGAFESLNSALLPLSRLIYDMFVKSILQIVAKLDLSVKKLTSEEVSFVGHWHPSYIVTIYYNRSIE